MGILKPIHVCILKPQIQIQIPFIKPSNLNQPNPQTITKEGTFSSKKKEKIEQIKRKKKKNEEGGA